MAMSQATWRREQERRRRERKRRQRRRRILFIIILLAIIAAIIVFVLRSCSAPDAAPAAETSSENTELATPIPRYTTSADIGDIDTDFFNNSAFLGNSVANSIYNYNLLPSTDFYTSVNLDVDNVYTTIIGSSTTTAADQLKTKKFNKIFLSFGEREIKNDNLYDFIDSYKSLVERIKSYQNTAQIYLISITPVTKDVSDTHAYGISMSAINEYNDEIKEMASDLGVFYVNSSAAVGAGSGYLPDGVSSDGINLNKDCCIELLTYITSRSHNPDAVEDDDEEDDDNKDNSESTDSPDTTEKPSQSPKPTQKPTAATEEPEPTVNVLKDSEIKKTE